MDSPRTLQQVVLLLLSVVRPDLSARLPAMARQPEPGSGRPMLVDELMTMVTSALDGVGAQHWAVPRPSPGIPSVGVRDSQRALIADALSALTGRNLSVSRLRRLPTRDELTEESARTVAGDAAIARIMLEDGLPATRVGHPETYIDLEFWSAAGGILRGPRPTAFGPTLPDRNEPPRYSLGTRGMNSQLRTYPEFAAAPINSARFPVDAVYTWVDTSDSRWRASLRQVARTHSTHAEDIAPNRFRSRDELRYSLRALDDYAPWIRSIYVVTAGDIPPWLATTSRLRIVEHKEILEKEWLPTFNSHAIEAALHRIPGLSEHFLYFNDDVVLLSRAWPEDYFEGNGAPRFFMAPQYYSVEKRPIPGYKAAALRGRDFIQRAYGVTPARYFRHTPHAHRVSTLESFEPRPPGHLCRYSQREDSRTGGLQHSCVARSLLWVPALAGCSVGNKCGASQHQQQRRPITPPGNV